MVRTPSLGPCRLTSFSPGWVTGLAEGRLLNHACPALTISATNSLSPWPLGRVIARFIVLSSFSLTWPGSAVSPSALLSLCCLLSCCALPSPISVPCWEGINLLCYSFQQHLNYQIMLNRAKLTPVESLLSWNFPWHQSRQIVFSWGFPRYRGQLGNLTWTGLHLRGLLLLSGQEGGGERQMDSPPLGILRWWGCWGSGASMWHLGQ